MRGKVAIIGAGLVKFGELFNKSYYDLIGEAANACIESVDKGIDLEKEVQAGWIGTCMGGISTQRDVLSGAGLITSLPYLKLKPVTRVENACATGSDAFRNAAFSVASGVYDIVVAVGAEKMREKEPQNFLRYVAEREQIFNRGLIAPSYFAMYANAWAKKYANDEKLREYMSKVAVKNHHNGTLCPYSHFSFEITEEQASSAPLVSYPFRLFDCCPQTDGAAMVILCKAEIAKKYTDSPIYLLGTGQAADVYWIPNRQSLTSALATVNAAKEAYKMAKIEPKDLDFAEVHDCFTFTELLDYEDLGLCKPGEAGKLITEGEVCLDGRIPVNTSGGLKAKGHPIGATGIGQICENWFQLRNEARKRQISGAEIGLQHNLGGPLAIGCVNIFTNKLP
ncbi:MAG: thiolase C-terminal domain-containing protein [Candidatus Helarchaeota archaeon]